MENMGDGKKRKLEDEINGTPFQLSREDLRKLMEPLSKEQLVALMVKAGSLYPAIAEDIRDFASKDPAHRKLFVRGLAWETSSQTLREAFERYGEIEEGAVIIDKATGKSRGFGFITFKHMDSAQRALKEPSKTIDGRITVSNLASASINPAQAADQAQRKLYIGGLSYETPNEKIINIFSQFGEIEEGSVAYDKNTNKSRGFAFVTFKTVEATKRALEEPNKSIDGRVVNVKLAVEGQKEKAASQPAPSPPVHVASHIQTGYAAVNPNLTSYPRPQVPASAPPTIGFSAYPPGLAAYASQPPYATQTTYTGIAATSQYGAVAPAAQYNPAKYAQYATFQTPQLAQPGVHTTGTAASGVARPYRGST